MSQGASTVQLAYGSGFSINLKLCVPDNYCVLYLLIAQECAGLAFNMKGLGSQI